MEFVFDMGDHARFVWPAYAAFVVIFSGLCLWVRMSSKKARAELERQEQARGKRQ